jgi:phospholipid/cholesterol/gamma-HCH transport system permease protein
LIATAAVLPLLTIIADLIGLIGGYVIAYALFDIRAAQYWTSAWQVLEYNDVVQGLVKPFMFAMIVALVGCFYGMRTTGGTQGVGLSTTKAVVVSSVWIFVVTYFIGQIFVNL